MLSLTVVVSLLATTLAVSQSSGGEIPAIQLTHFDENYLKTVPTGGNGTLIGVTAGEDDPEYLLKPALFVPERVYAKSAALCVETVSIDGAYWSRGEITASDLRSHHGTVRLLPNSNKTHDPHGTQWSHEIEQFGPRNLAVLTSTGSCGSDENRNTREYVVVDRSKEPNGAGTRNHYRLAVNPRLADSVEVRYRLQQGNEARIGCMPAERTFHNIAFSVVCHLTGPFSETTPVELLPSRHGRPLPPYRFTLTYAQSR